MHRNGDSSIVALCVFGCEAFTGPLPSNALAIHVTIFRTKDKEKYEADILGPTEFFCKSYKFQDN
jgi:hypothetical protein